MLDTVLLPYEAYIIIGIQFCSFKQFKQLMYFLVPINAKADICKIVLCKRISAENYVQCSFSARAPLLRPALGRPLVLRRDHRRGHHRALAALPRAADGQPRLVRQDHGRGRRRARRSLPGPARDLPRRLRANHRPGRRPARAGLPRPSGARRTDSKRNSALACARARAPGAHRRASSRDRPSSSTGAPA